MPLTREKKEEVVKSVTDVLRGSAAAVFVNFHGLSVFDAEELRSGLKEHGVEYRVVKKTLLARALHAARPAGERPALPGEIALSTGDDAVLPARELLRFAKAHEGTISLVGGVFEGEYIDADRVRELAEIPSRDVLYGRLVGMMNAPISQFARTASETYGSFVRVLNEVATAKN